MFATYLLKETHDVRLNISAKTWGNVAAVFFLHFKVLYIFSSSMMIIIILLFIVIAEIVSRKNKSYQKRGIVTHKLPLYFLLINILLVVDIQVQTLVFFIQLLLALVVAYIYIYILYYYYLQHFSSRFFLYFSWVFIR